MIFNSLRGISVLCACLVLNAGCNKETVYTGETHSGGKVMILGHMGMGTAFQMPGNTYESISTAISIGCDGAEIDIQMSRDSILVAFHDGELSGQTTCEGRITDRDWKDIRECRYSLAARPILLYTVEEMFTRFPNLTDLYFSFDCKLASTPDQDAYEYRCLRAIRRLCDKYGMGGRVFIEGPQGFLDKARSMGLENKLFLFSDVDHAIDSAKQKFYGISVTMEVTADHVARAFRNGLCTMVWDPDNYGENKAVLAKSPDIIQTDDPISMLKLLKRYNYENTTP